jgi:soluble lytic murein transglycosylase-like protein
MKEIALKTGNTDKHLSQMAELKSRYDDKQKAKIAKAANEFESLLTAMMLRSMTKTTGGMLGEEGYGNDMFDTIFEQQIAVQISKSKNLGIAEAIYRKVTGEEMSSTIKKYDSKPVDFKIDDAALPVKVKPNNEALKRLNRFDELIEEASGEFGLDKNLIKSVIMTESAANHKAVSSAKAKGLMQLIDSTASDMGVKNVFDPKQNIYGGTKYLSKMLRQYNGDLKLALAAYNAGPRNVEKFNGVPPFDETKNYIAKVLGYLNHFRESDS